MLRNGDGAISNLLWLILKRSGAKTAQRCYIVIKSNHDTGIRATTFDQIAHVRRVSATLPLVLRREER